MRIRQNYSSPTPTLPHMKLIPKIYKDINPDIEKQLDTSDYPTDHSSGFKTGLISKVLGMFKDKLVKRRLLNLLV